MAEEVETEVAAKPTTRKIKPSSLISNDAVSKIKEQVQELRLKASILKI